MKSQVKDLDKIWLYMPAAILKNSAATQPPPGIVEKDKQERLIGEAIK